MASLLMLPRAAASFAAEAREANAAEGSGEEREAREVVVLAGSPTRSRASSLSSAAEEAWHEPRRRRRATVSDPPWREREAVMERLMEAVRPACEASAPGLCLR